MKKSVILIIAVMAILVFCLVGCSATPAKQIEKTQKAWDAAENKEATDSIVIKDINLGKFAYIDNVEASLSRKFEGNKITATAEVKNLAFHFADNEAIKKVLDLVAGVAGDAFPALDVDKIQQNIGQVSLKASVTLTDKKTLVGSVIINNLDKIIDGQKAETKIDINTTLNYAPENDFSVAIGAGIDLVLSHFGATVFNPAEDGKANFNAAPFNAILKGIVDFSETKYKNEPGYTPISQTIKNIAGTDYDKILTDKVKVVKPTYEGKYEKGMITEMKVGAEKVEILYNLDDIKRIAGVAVGMIPGAESFSSLVGQVFNILNIKNISKEHCIEIGQISVNSTYKINK